VLQNGDILAKISFASAPLEQVEYFVTHPHAPSLPFRGSQSQ
jgi:hypothetical protein